MRTARTHSNHRGSSL